MLLYRVQLLVDQHPNEHQQEYARSRAEHAYRDGKPVDLGQQLRLLLVHMRTRIIQKQLVIPVHCECALVDQQEDQTNCKSPEHHGHNSQRHKAPRPVSNSVAAISRPTRSIGFHGSTGAVDFSLESLVCGIQSPAIARLNTWLQPRILSVMAMFWPTIAVHIRFLAEC